MPSVTNHSRHPHLFSENPLYCFIQNIDIIQQRVKGKTFLSVINDFRREIKQQRNVIGHWLSWSQWSEQSTKQILRVRKRRESGNNQRSVSLASSCIQNPRMLLNLVKRHSPKTQIKL